MGGGCYAERSMPNYLPGLATYHQSPPPGLIFVSLKNILRRHCLGNNQLFPPFLRPMEREQVKHILIWTSAKFIAG